MADYEGVSEKNRGLIQDFLAYKRANNITEARIVNLERNLIYFARENPDVTTVGEKEVVNFINKLKTATQKYNGAGFGKVVKIDGKYSPRTIEQVKLSLKPFYKWLNNGKYPVFIENLKVNQHPTEVQEADILTTEEVAKMAGVAITSRDRAAIWCLYESGCRCAEFLDWRRQDVKIDGAGALVTVRTSKAQHGSQKKTRQVRIYHGATALSEWMASMKDRDPSAFVWCKMAQTRNQPIEKFSLNRLLKDAARRSGVEQFVANKEGQWRHTGGKHVHAHIFRHSICTLMAQKLSDESMRILFGWSGGSRMPSTYSHLSAEQVDAQVLGVYGEQPIQKTGIGVVECLRCRRQNPKADSIEACLGCGFPLNPEAAKNAYNVMKTDADVGRFIQTELPKIAPELAKQLIATITEKLGG